MGKTQLIRRTDAPRRSTVRTVSQRGRPRPWIMSIRISTLRRPISSIGWQRVVSMGWKYSDMVRPSMAITEQSSGTRRPASRSARMAPSAMLSAMANTAVKSAPCRSLSAVAR